MDICNMSIGLSRSVLGAWFLTRIWVGILGGSGEHYILHQESMPNQSPWFKNLTRSIVATLAFGLRPKQRACKGAGQEEAQESHHILLGM
jgi:hypothetical protein